MASSWSFPPSMGDASTSNESAEELRDELDMQSILIDSLTGTAEDTPARRAELQQGLKDLQRRLAMALRAQSTSRAPSTAPLRPGGLQGATDRTQSDNSHSRKRTFSAHNGGNFDHLYASTSKSRRTTPSPNDSDLAGTRSSSPIDLSEATGNGAEFVNRQKMEAERLRRLRLQKEADEAYVRSLMAETQDPSQSQLPGISQHKGPSAFDRIRQPVFSQSSQNSQNSAVSSPVSPGRVLPTHTRIDSPAASRDPLQSRPINGTRAQMPGSFNDDEDEGFSSDASNDLSTHEVIDLTGSSGPSTYTIPKGQRPPTDYARAAALQRHRQMGHGFSTYSGEAPPFLNVPQPPGSSSSFVPGSSVYGSGRSFNTGMSGAFPGQSLGDPYTNPYLASHSNRPGSLVGGSANPFGFPGALNGFAGGGSGLASLINRTANIDYQNGLDAFGNPLDSRLQDYIHDIVDDPRKNEEEIKELLANIRPDMEIPEEDRADDPIDLRYPLYPHQRIALTWMHGQEDDEKKRGGILADDMGLGKTISTLALIVSRKAQPPAGQRTIKAKTNLIVGPVGLIRQWEREMNKKLKGSHKLSVFLAHGKKSKYEDLRTFDVVLTSYGTLAAELSKREKYIKEVHGNGGVTDNAELDKLCPMLGPNCMWYRVILDEAQCIKNSKTQSAKAAYELKSQFRWCLSGTPMMNKVSELGSLIQFLRIKPYDDPKKFTRAFGSLAPNSRSTSDGSRSRAMRQLQVTLKAIMLRRSKKSQIDGKPIIQLPEKHEETVHVVFNEDEDKFYRDLEQHSQVQVSKFLKNGTVGKHYANILALLTRLRQACCHPLLHMMDFSQGGTTEISETDMAALAETLTPDVVKRIKETEEFECPICMDAVQNPSIFVPCGHDTCSECLVCLANGSNEQGIQAGNENAKANCPECRGPIDFMKIVTLEVFKQVHMPETIKPEPSTSTSGMDVDDSGSETASDDDDDDLEGDSDTDSETNSDEDDDEVDATGNLKGFVIRDDDIKDEDSVDSDSDFAAPEELAAKMKGAAKVTTRSKKKSKKSRRRQKTKGNGKGKGKEKEEPVQPHMLRKLRTEARKNREAHRRYMKYLREIWEPSAKVTKCIELISDIQSTGEKTIVFSQWTLLLDLLETPLKHDLHVGYRRYDGSMTAKERDAAASEFTERPDVRVMLVSLKAGNAGLNLTAASQVIIVDPFWNPYIEMQAIDRAHRIGQQKEVNVHRILVENTVEDRIMDIQQKKREMVDKALNEEDAKGLGRLSAKDLGYLFGIGTRPDGAAPGQ